MKADPTTIVSFPTLGELSALSRAGIRFRRASQLWLGVVAGQLPAAALTFAGALRFAPYSLTALEHEIAPLIAASTTGLVSEARISWQ
jgi:hypothetical protein